MQTFQIQSFKCILQITTTPPTIDIGSFSFKQDICSIRCGFSIYERKPICLFHFYNTFKNEFCTKYYVIWVYTSFVFLFKYLLHQQEHFLLES